MNTYDNKSLNCLYHKNISENITVEKKTHYFVFNNLLSENRDPYEILRKKKYGTARQVTDDNVTWLILFACRVNNARIETHTFVPLNTYCFNRIGGIGFIRLRIRTNCTLLWTQ